MRALFIDVPYLKAASGWGRYKTRRGRTKYGCLNVPIDGGREVVAYDFCPDKNGDISVNIRKRTRDLDREYLQRMDDFRGFIISKNGFIRPLDENRANHRERRNPRKSENWRLFAEWLIAYLDTLRGEEE